MSIFSGWFAIAEADALAIIAKVKQGFAVLETDLQSVNSWVLNNAPTVVSDIQAVLGVVASLSTGGVALPAAVLEAAKAAEDAAAGIAQYVSKSKAGSTTISAVIAGYGAIKQAAAAHATTAAHIAAIPPAAVPTVAK